MVKNIIAGDSYKLSFPANYDTLEYSPKLIINNGVNAFEKVGDANNEVLLTPTETALYPPGEYAYSMVLFNANERITIESGFLNVIGDVAISGTDVKNKFKKIVDALDASILGVATLAQKQTQIEGRSIERFSPEELIKLRDKYQRLSDQEDKRLKGKPLNKKIYVRF